MPNSRRNTRLDVDRREVAAVLKSRLDEECAPPLGARPSRARRTRVKVLVTNGNATGSTHRRARRRQAPCQGGGGVLSSVGVGRIKEERLPPRHRGVRSFRLTAVVNSEMNNRDAKVNNERLLTSATRTMSRKNRPSLWQWTAPCRRRRGRSRTKSRANGVGDAALARAARWRGSQVRLGASRGRRSQWWLFIDPGPRQHDRCSVGLIEIRKDASIGTCQRVHVSLVIGIPHYECLGVPAFRIGKP